MSDREVPYPLAVMRATIARLVAEGSPVIVEQAAPVGLTCYACHAAVGDTARRCDNCGNVVRCKVEGCDADMSEMKCPDDKSSCLDHCGEDHD